MKVAYKMIGNTSGSTIKAFFFILSVSIFSVLTTHGQDSTAALPDSAEASVSVSEDGPSISNLSKNLAESSAELERIRKEEILSYVYMGLGFSVVIGIAWFTTVLARKRKKKDDEIRALRIHHNKHHHKAHHPKR